MVVSYNIYHQNDKIVNELHEPFTREINIILLVFSHITAFYILIVENVTGSVQYTQQAQNILCKICQVRG